MLIQFKNSMITHIGVIIFVIVVREACAVSKKRYLSMEQPKITWFNPKYVRYINISAQRYSREDPLYYTRLHLDLIWPIHHNVNVDMYLYEFVTNQYKPTAFELHFEMCELLVKNLFFGMSLGIIFPYSCPIPAGPYHVDNATVPLKTVPDAFPFTKGRVLSNFTSKTTHESVATGYVDLVIKQDTIRKTTN